MMAKKFIAVLRQSLRKVEPNSSSCNASCNKNVAWVYDCKACAHVNFACNLCRNKIERVVAICETYYIV